MFGYWLVAIHDGSTRTDETMLTENGETPTAKADRMRKEKKAIFMFFSKRHRLKKPCNLISLLHV